MLHLGTLCELLLTIIKWVRPDYGMSFMSAAAKLCSALLVDSTPKWTVAVAVAVGVGVLFCSAYHINLS